MQRVIPVLCFVFLIGSENEAKITCSVPRVEPLQDTVLTCSFPEDLSVTKKDFTVYHYENPSNPEAVLDCWWLHGILDCFAKEGVSFNKTVSTRLDIVVMSVEPTRTGAYACQVAGYGPSSLQTCQLLLQLGEYNTCNISVEESQSHATLTCYLNEDVGLTHRNFAVYKHNGSGEHTKVLDCWWENKEPKCSWESGNKSFLKVFSSSLIMNVPKETRSTNYSCGHANDKFEDQKMCRFKIDDSGTGNRKTEEQGSAVTGVVVGLLVVLIVVVAAGVIIFRCRRRLQKFLEAIRNKETDVEEALLGTGTEVSLVKVDQNEVKDPPAITTASLSFLSSFVKDMFPDTPEVFCLTPSVYFNTIRYKEVQVAEQLVYIPEASNSVTETHDKAVQHVLYCLRHIPQLTQEEIFVVTQCRYKAFQNDDTAFSGNTSLKPLVRETREEAKCFDLMIVHRHHGITVVVVKDVGDDEGGEEQEVDQNVLTQLSEAVQQLRNADGIVSHVMSDKARVLKIHKALMLPNLSLSTLRRALERDASLAGELHECLNTEASKVSMESSDAVSEKPDNKAADEIQATISKTRSGPYENVQIDTVSQEIRQELPPTPSHESLSSDVERHAAAISESPTDDPGEGPPVMAPERATNNDVTADDLNGTVNQNSAEKPQDTNPECTTNKPDEHLSGHNDEFHSSQAEDNCPDKSFDSPTKQKEHNFLKNPAKNLVETVTVVPTSGNTEKERNKEVAAVTFENDSKDASEGLALTVQRNRTDRDPSLSTPRDSALTSSSDATSKLCEDLVNACLCADELSDPDCPWDVTPAVLGGLQTWWTLLMSSCRRDKEVNDDGHYTSGISRFHCPATASKLLMAAGDTQSVMVRMTFDQTVFVTGELYERLVIYPDMMDFFEMPRLFLCGPPGTGKTAMLMLAGKRWLSDGHDVYILNTLESGATCRLEQLLESPSSEQLSGGRTRGRVVVYSPDLSDEKNIKEALKKIMKQFATNTDPMHILADGFDCSNEEVKQYLENVFQHNNNVCNMWIASSRDGNCPMGWRKQTLTRPLTCPPAIMREASNLLVDHLANHVTRYTLSGYPVPTDGPPVKHIYHQGEGHTTGQPRDCEQCAVEVAVFLKHILRISKAGGALDTEGVTKETLDARIGASNLTSLGTKDVLILFETEVDSSGVVMTKKLFQSNIPVLLVDMSTPYEETQDGNDIVVAGEANLLRGLKRKVVVYVEDKVDNLNSDILWTRLCGITSCTSQLIWIQCSGNQK